MRYLALVTALVACSGGNTDDVDCEVLEDATCAPDSGGEVDCPNGYNCSGIPAYWCYRGEECVLPECLPPATLIATPAGEIPVSDLAIGSTVWTVGAKGQRVPAPLVSLGSVPVPATHTVVSVTLSDGRSIRASGGHPTADGRRLDRLGVADELDGAAVTSVAVEPYAEPRTFDLLPEGPTGAYWANGVLLGSTLRRAVPARTH